jgi:RsiW-degrading membrane proteinase PrsW (M82 family)
MNSVPASKSKVDLIFVIFAIFGSMANLFLGFLFVLISLSSILSGTGASIPPPTWWAIAFGFLALCGVPSIYFGFRMLTGRTSPPKGGLSAAALFVIQLVRRFEPALSQRRVWGQFILGLWVVPLFALVSEFLILIPTMVLFGIGALTTENGRLLLDLLSETPAPSVGAISEAANGILMEPWFVILLLGFFAVLVPIIEEVLKTIVVWPWIIKGRNSVEAFLGGVIGGTGYALFEAIFLTQTEPTWLPTMVGRAGATIMHAFTTGVASWGLSEGIRNKRWGRTVIGFVVAVTFHGLWNAGAVSIALIDLRLFQTGEISTFLEIVQMMTPILIIALALTALTGLSQLSKRFSASLDELPPSDLVQDTV